MITRKRTRSVVAREEGRGETDKAGPSKKTQKMRRYRSNVHKDPERLEGMRKKDRERKRKKREEQRKKIKKGDKALAKKLKENHRKYIATYRAKVKKNKKNNQEVSAIKENAVLRTQRWRLRVNLSELKNKQTTDEAKSNNKNPNQRGNVETKDFKSRESETDNSTDENNNSVTCASRWTIYRGVKKVRKVLPATPRKKVAIIEKLINSPSTSKALEKKGRIMSPSCKKKLDLAESLIHSVSEKITKVKPRKCDSSQRAYKTLMHTVVSAASVCKKYSIQSKLALFNINKRTGRRALKNQKQPWWKPDVRKRRKDRISESTRGKVQEFYLSAEVSREVPNKRDVVCIKDNGKKEFVQKHVMIMTTSEAYALFKSQNKDIKIGLSTFKSFKPKQVRRISETSRKSCLCQICCNLALKAEALKTLMKKHDSIQALGIKADKKVLAEATLCKTEGEHHKNGCLNRSCNNCGSHKIREHLRSIEDLCSKDSIMIDWHKWESMMVDRHDGGNNAKKRIITCKPKTTSFAIFVDDLESSLREYPMHKFRAEWQQLQQSLCKEQLKPNELMMVMDFSENYKCSFQNEVQSAFFDQNLVTIHPVMCYYKQKVKDTEYLFKHSITCISNDLKHDSTLVKEFEDRTFDIIQDQQALDSVYQWTDGCAAQYKCKTAFGYISNRQKDVCRNYYETSHGKNVCDGLGAVVKNSCYRAMLTGKVIGNAADLYKHCNETLAHNMRISEKEKTISIRQFVFVDKDEVDRNNLPDFNVLPGTRKVHHVRNTGTSLKVESRNLSCYCQGCIRNDQCQNNEYIEEWSIADLTPKMQTNISKQSGQKQSNGSGRGRQRSQVLEKSSSALVMGPPNISSPASNTTAGASSSDKECEVDEFVEVRIKARRSGHKLYVGQILEIDEASGEVNVSFLVESSVKGRKLYYWPESVDLSWEPKSSITKRHLTATLSDLSTNTRQLYTIQ